MIKLRVYTASALLQKALTPKRKLVTRGGKTFMTTVYVGSTKKERKEQERKKAVMKPQKRTKKRSRSTVELMRDQRKAIDHAPNDKQAVDKVLAFQRDYYSGHTEPSIYDAVEAATEEVRYALERPEDSGKDWYHDSMETTRAILTTKFPDLAGEQEWDFFLSALSAMSPGTEPKANLRMAVTMYNHYKKTGELSILNPETGKAYGVASTQGMTKFKNLFNSFNSKSEFVQFMNGVSTVGELKDNYGKDVTGYKVNIKGDRDEAAFNSMVLGEKVGQFYQSLRGTDGAVAVDRWAIRSFYRWTGQLREGSVTTKEKGVQGRAVDDTVSAEAQKAAEYVMQTVGDRLGLNGPQVQAVMWYYEKRLYSKLGISNVGQTADYAHAAEDLYMQKSMSSEDFREQIKSMTDNGTLPSFREVLDAVMHVRR